MIKKYALIFTFLLSFLSACGQQETLDEIEANMSKQKEPQEVRKTIDGVEYYLKINDTNFSLNHEIIITGRVTNISEETIDFIGYSGCDDGLHVSIPIPIYESRFLIKGWEKSEPIPCTEAIEDYKLNPGETLTESTVFIPRMNIGKENSLDVPTGEYKVNLIFQKGRIDSREHPSIELSFFVDGAEKLITKKEATLIANENQELIRWLSIRQGLAITKEENSNYYVMFDGEWEKAEEEYFKEMLDYTPEYSVHLDGQEWIINYFDKIQGPPHRFEIKVDAKMGVITEVNQYEY